MRGPPYPGSLETLAGLSPRSQLPFEGSKNVITSGRISSFTLMTEGGRQIATTYPFLMVALCRGLYLKLEGNSTSMENGILTCDPIPFARIPISGSEGAMPRDGN